MHALAVLLAALLAVSAVSGARVRLEALAPAPAPAASKPAADLLFTLSASKATFTAADRLTLSGLQTTAQAFNTETRATGIYGLGTFANVSAGAPFAPAWAGSPDAVMYATANGSRVSALLALSEPVFNAEAGKMTFAVRLLLSNAAQLSLSGGATARAADDAANGLGSSLLTEVPVGAELTSAALFIDEASVQVGAAATTKDCWNCGGGFWNGGGWGNSWGGGWDQSYQQPSQTNINNNNIVQNQGWNSPNTNINNNNVQNNGWNGGQTNINNNNVANGNSNGNTNINNNNVGNSGTNINNNNAGK
ncbi:hypothetical protein WJX81_003775 [Elliptochloris bilobata]|uniref:Uncharacterized protein n=1 Tax=Elliptochloris bilobata TaxID=381761 RepID=A0AAW1SCV5_9CHLO